MSRTALSTSAIIPPLVADSGTPQPTTRQTTAPPCQPGLDNPNDYIGALSPTGILANPNNPNDNTFSFTGPLRPEREYGYDDVVVCGGVSGHAYGFDALGDFYGPTDGAKNGQPREYDVPPPPGGTTQLRWTYPDQPVGDPFIGDSPWPRNLAGNAINEAAKNVRRKILKLAGDVLEAAEEDLEIADGRVHVKGAPQRSITLSQLAKDANPLRGAVKPGTEPGLEAANYFGPSRGATASGVHAMIVEVDPETMLATVQKYVVVHDCGRVINPLILDGQDCVD